MADDLRSETASERVKRYRLRAELAIREAEQSETARADFLRIAQSWEALAEYAERGIPTLWVSPLRPARARTPAEAEEKSGEAGASQGSLPQQHNSECLNHSSRFLVENYSNPEKPTNRYIDIGLVDANGHLDLIEIKKPFASCLVSEGQYRGNFTPRKELSGAVMQAEKYLFHLNKWGVEGEKDINRRQSRHLPAGTVLRITNPRAIIIAGRSHTLSHQQLFDFEFMKRKYANIMDILSYDDLLLRLSNIVNKFRAKP